jgi:dTMP kinase
MSGLFITFEGGEGSGKSTQIQLLINWFSAHYPGREILTTREPGGTAEAERIRDILVTGSAEKLSVEAEALLMIASRTEHVQKVIVPALRRGAIILCDRFSDSTLVYQGLAHDLSIDKLVAIHEFGFDDLRPDLTFLMDVPAELGLQRAGQRQMAEPGKPSAAESRFEDKGIEFHQRVRAGFLALADRYNERIIIIDASQSAEHSNFQVKEHLINKLPDEL